MLRSRSLFVVTLVIALGLTSSCGGGTAETKSAPKRVVAEPAPEPMDGFSQFDGQRVALGEEVKLRREPVGVTELRAIVALARTDWVIRTRGDGGEDKTATASLVVQRGGDAANVRIEAGESGSARGVHITVHEAGEVYEEESMRWVQFARITVSAPPN